MRQAVATVAAEARLMLVAGLIRRTGDWELAEDCVQDAIERALQRWPVDGIPGIPAAWLTTTAHRRALDILRRRRTEAEKLLEVAAMIDIDERMSGQLPLPDPDHGGYGDDRLRLLFTCCHPALPLAGQAALTLKTVAGLSISEIARAFLVSEATMSQRLLRTRSKIRNTGIGFSVPEPHRVAGRTAAVLAVIYLIFNAGYDHDGDDHRQLGAEAVRLVRVLSELLPDEDEVLGLRALLLLLSGRRATRVDAHGDVVPMLEQDRLRWDRSMIAAGVESLRAARATGRPPGVYRLQAEIAALHATALSAEQTDWHSIILWYDALALAQRSPVVLLNRAVAVGFGNGPEAGLRELAEVERSTLLANYHLLPAVRADFLRRLGRLDEALVAYQDALRLAPTAAEARFLQRRIDETIASSRLDAPWFDVSAGPHATTRPATP